MSTFEMHYSDVCGKAVGEYGKKRLLFERPLPTRVTFIGKKIQKDITTTRRTSCASRAMRRSTSFSARGTSSTSGKSWASSVC